jgi:inner membrane protein
MEPVAHLLTGACIGRAGLNRKTAYATLVAVLTAEAADIDVLWGIGGPVEELKHHRGITHTLVGAPVVAAAAVGVVWLFDRWMTARRLRKANAHAQNIESPTRPDPQRIHWGWLYLTALLSALSHLLLDWTNNYGLRPFFPFNPRWYAGSFVFIIEPVLWVLLGSALVIPALLGLIGGEIGVRRTPFRGRGWAIFALTGMVLLWGWRWAEQGRARMLVESAQIATAPVKRMALEPFPITPFHWHTIQETSAYYQTAEVNTFTGEIVSDPLRNIIFKPSVTPAVEAAKQTFLGQVYLDWGTWAVVRDVGPAPIPGLVQSLDPPQLPHGRQWTTVQFTDLRFGYPIFGLGLGRARRSNAPPLAGWVYIVDGRDDAGEAMNGRVQR